MTYGILLVLNSGRSSKRPCCWDNYPDSIDMRQINWQTETALTKGRTNHFITKNSTKNQLEQEQHMVQCIPLQQHTQIEKALLPPAFSHTAS